MVDRRGRVTPADLRKVFIRSHLLQGAWNFERMQALGFCFSLIPVIDRLYPQPGEPRRRAIERHLKFFNTHPYMAGLILGITIALEEHCAATGDDDSSIVSLKIGLMGPLAGIGDPIFWGTIRPVIAALGASIAVGGNPLGPLLFFSSFNLIRFGTRHWGLLYGYRRGIDIVGDVRGKILKQLTEGATILGLFVMGALVGRSTYVKASWVLSNRILAAGETEIVTLQSILDQITPGLLPLLLTLGCMKLLRKGVTASTIIAGLLCAGMLGHWSKFLSI